MHVCNFALIRSARRRRLLLLVPNFAAMRLRRLIFALLVRRIVLLDDFASVRRQLFQTPIETDVSLLLYLNLIGCAATSLGTVVV